MDDVESDFKNMGLKRWRTKALDRIELASVMREARPHLKGHRSKKREGNPQQTFTDQKEELAHPSSQLQYYPKWIP